MKNTTHTYLTRYAQPEVKALDKSAPSFNKKYALVIPCYKENKQFIDTLCQHPDAQNTLLILVVNQPETTHENYTLDKTNAQLLKHIALHGEQLWMEDVLRLYQYHNLLILLVNKTEPLNSIAKKQGVGCARKIGADIAINLIEKKYVITPVIFSTDADASLPSNYFSCIDTNNRPPVSAWVYNYHHCTVANTLGVATLLYENAIKYYKNGLAWAGSPYGFHTLGSVIAINADAYCKVRGFPKLAAGEDFYLLNKLAKIGRIESLNEATVLLQARTSDRVPFGTGPSVNNIIEQGLIDKHANLNVIYHYLLDNQQSSFTSFNIKEINYDYYNPHCFKALKCALSKVTILWDSIQGTHNAQDALNITYSQSDYATQINAAFISLGFNALILHSKKQCKNIDAFKHHFHTWFDAFRTLKFIHYLRDNHFKDKPLLDCLKDTDISG